MTTHDFAFVVDADPDAGDWEDRFIAAGCDDATFLVQRGAAVLSFDRTAPDYRDAVLSAYRDIRAAGAEVLRFEPDYLVSQTEIAERAGLTRAAVGLFEKGERRAGFPRPVARFGTARPLWDWVAVSGWLAQEGLLPEDETRKARISRLVNIALHLRTVRPELATDIERDLSAA